MRQWDDMLDSCHRTQAHVSSHVALEIQLHPIHLKVGVLNVALLSGLHHLADDGSLDVPEGSMRYSEVTFVGSTLK